MLYNKKAVEKSRRKPVSRVRSSPWIRKFGNNMKADLGPKIKIKNPIRALTDLTRSIHQLVSYDEGHDEFEGARSVVDVLVDRKGDCFEQQNALLEMTRFLYPEIARKLGIVISKNPLAYEGCGIDEVGVHPFLVYRHKGKDYFFDAVGGYRFEKPKVEFTLGLTPVNRSEFQAFRLELAAEDLVFNHKKFREALRTLDLAVSIDPNNYSLYCMKGWTLFEMGKNPRAEKEYETAISIAPAIVEPHLEYADFCSCAYPRRNKAKYQYKAASEKETEDIQVLKSLEDELTKLHEQDFAERVRNKRLALMQGKYKVYSDHIRYIKPFSLNEKYW